MGRFLTLAFGILIIAVLAGAATEAATVIGGKQTTSPERATSVTTKKVTPTLTTTPSVATTPASAAPSASTQPTTPTPAAITTLTATIVDYVHLRAQPTTASAIVTDLYAGDSVSYISVDSGLWQAVTYQGQAGYVYKSYLTY